MAHRIPKMYIEKKEWKIYILLFYPRKEFYIGISSQKELYYTLKDHCLLKINRTSKYISDYKEEGHIPQMYMLSAEEETKAKAFSRSLAWARLLVENSYVCINGETYTLYLNNLEGFAADVYNNIKDTDVQQLLSKENSLYPNYKPGRKQSTDKTSLVVNMRFTPEDYAVLERKAKECGISISGYVHHMALSGAVINMPEIPSGEYLKELRECISVLQQIEVTIYRLGQYFPKDLAKVDNVKDTIINHYSKFLSLKMQIYNKMNKFYKDMKNL